jgi:hypothetical protein
LHAKESIMFDRIFSAALAFCVLAGGTLALATEMLESARPQHRATTLSIRATQLPRVEVIGQRASGARAVAAADALQQRVQ